MDQSEENGATPCGLLHLSDCVLVYLLSFVDATCLYNLSRTCLRLKNLVEDNVFWRFIDARESPNTQEKIQYCCERINSSTNGLCLRSDRQFSVIVDRDFFVKINQFSHLRILVLENQSIGSLITVTNFPCSLEELSLRRTRIESCQEFFWFSGDAMTKLRVLLLDECNWLLSSCFLSISKYKSLEILSLYKCRGLDNSIPYLSLSMQFGFRKLKILDARLTVLGNTLIQSIYKSPTLLAVYLQHKDITYSLDYFKRQLALIENNKKPINYVYGFNEEYTESTIYKSSIINLDDHGLLDYFSTASCQNIGEMPKSHLYIDPYSRKCTCNYTNEFVKKDEPPKVYSSSSSSSDDDDDNDHQKKIIKQKKKFKLQIKLIQKCLRENSTKRVAHILKTNCNKQNSNSEPSKRQNNKRKISKNNDNRYNLIKKYKFSGDNNEAGPSGLSLNCENRYQNGDNQGDNGDNDGQNKDDCQNLDNRDNNSDNENDYQHCDNRSRDNWKQNRDNRNENNDYHDNGDKIRDHHTNKSHNDDNGKFLGDHNEAGPGGRSLDCDNCIKSCLNYDNRDDHGDNDGQCNDNGCQNCDNCDNKADNGHNMSDYHHKDSQSSHNWKQNNDNRKENNNYHDNDNKNRNYSKRFRNDDNDNDNNGYSSEEEEDELRNVANGAANRIVIIEPLNRPIIANPDNNEPLVYFRNLQQCPLIRVINLEAANDNNDDLDVKKIPLKRISLRGFHNITNKVLLYLDKLDLDILDLTYTSCTKSAIDLFLMEHPTCRVMHEQFCTCQPMLNF